MNFRDTVSFATIESKNTQKKAKPWQERNSREIIAKETGSSDRDMGVNKKGNKNEQEKSLKSIFVFGSLRRFKDNF